MEDLKRIEEYFHSEPDNFNSMKALEQVEEFTQKKKRMSIITEKEKTIKELA